MDNQFKKCSKCDFIWNKRDDFLQDKNLHIIGYEVSDDNLFDSLFLFNHNCGTTLAVKVGNFKDLYDGPVFPKRLNETDNCPDYCSHRSNLRPCPAKCKYTQAREIIKLFQKLPKEDTNLD